MATTTHLTTVEEYSRIPDPPGGQYELRHGELTLMSAPPRRHADIQDNISRWLIRHCRVIYRIRTEFACRPLPEYEVWVVDIGLTTKERWMATGESDWLAGSPELAIEILSPSNSKREIEDRRKTLFAGGCEQFWMVDGKMRTVTIHTHRGAVHVYSETEAIPVAPYSAEMLPLAEIFDV